ncbi:phage tail protein [Vibrio fluvialis]
MSLLITHAGIAAAIRAGDLGIEYKITHISIGSAGYVPNPEQTALVAEIQKKAITRGALVAQGQLHFETVWDGNEEFEGKELGYWLEDGTLFAVDSRDGEVITYKRKNTVVTEACELNLAASTIENITVEMLGSPYATEQVAGTAKIATPALVSAGVDDTTIVTPKKLAEQYLTRGEWLKHMLFKGMPMSAIGPEPDPDVWLPAGRVELLRAEYPTVFEIVSASSFFTDQAIIDADPRSYAGYWGTGNGETTFTTDDWALMMNIKVAGGYGASGSTKEDHIQNITAGMTGFVGSTGVVSPETPSGAFFQYNTGENGKLSGTSGTSSNYGFGFDASLVARADSYTDTMGLFLDHYRVIPKGVFSYA